MSEIICWVHVCVCVCRYLGGGDEGGEPILSLTQSYANSSSPVAFKHIICISVLKEQIILRDNAIEQADLLMEYKHLFIKHPSHHYAFKDQGGGGTRRGEKETTTTAAANGGMGLMSIFTSLLAEPLSKTGSSRTSADHLTIELVLHLIRNLLSISPLNTFGSPEKSQYASQLHRELLIVLQEEMVLDVLVCVGQEVERRENSGYNLLLMEILSCLLRGQVRGSLCCC